MNISNIQIKTLS